MIRNSINFCANLKIDRSVYENVPQKAAFGYPENVIEEYKKFLDIPKIKQLSEGDTVELRAKRYCGRGFALEINFICKDNPDKTILGAGIYNSRNEANITSASLIYQTCQYLCEKFDLNQNSIFARHNPLKVLVDAIKSGKIG